MALDPALPVLVTGAAGGIGQAILRRLRADGRAVIGLDIAPAPAALADCPWLQCDLATLTRAADIAARLPSILGGLVHAAGAIVVGRLRDIADTDWDRLFALHVKAPHALTVAAWPRLASGSSVVFVSSISAQRATPDAAAYSATKAAQRNLAATFAVAMADDGIRVNIVCPGLIDTAMTDAMNITLATMRGESPEAVATSRSSGIPQGRPGSADEVAGAVRYLLSDDATYVTGTTLAVAGGVLAGAV